MWVVRKILGVETRTTKQAAIMPTTLVYYSLPVHWQPWPEEIKRIEVIGKIKYESLYSQEHSQNNQGLEVWR